MPWIAVVGIQIRIHGDKIKAGLTPLNHSEQFLEIAIVITIDELCVSPVVKFHRPGRCSGLSAVCEHNDSFSAAHVRKPLCRPVERFVEVLCRDSVLRPKSDSTSGGTRCHSPDG